MLRKCILVLSNTFYNAFFDCTAELVASSDEIAKSIQTYQQRIFVDGDYTNYHSDLDGLLTFGLTGVNNYADSDVEFKMSFLEELKVPNASKLTCIDRDEECSLFDELEYLHGIFVTKGINSIVTVYFSD